MDLEKIDKHLDKLSDKWKIFKKISNIAYVIFGFVLMVVVMFSDASNTWKMAVILLLLLSVMVMYWLITKKEQ